MAVLLAAKCILGAASRGGGGAPAALRSLVLVWLFGLHQVWALQPLVATLARLHICREFVSSLALRFGLLFPRGGPKRSWNSYPPPRPILGENKKLSIGFFTPLLVQFLRVEGEEVVVLPRGEWEPGSAWRVHRDLGLGWEWRVLRACQQLPRCASSRTASLPSSPAFPGAEAVSLSF